MRTLVFLIFTLFVRVQSTNLWTLLRVWDPQAPISWETSDLDQQCVDSMKQYSYGLSQRQVWASKMLDASGRSSGRFLFGSEFWLGSRVQCGEIDREARLLEGVANVTSLPPPPRVVYRVVTLSVNLSLPLTPQARKISLGVCIPETCGAPETTIQLMRLMVDATSPPAPYFRDIKVQRVRVLPGAYTFWSDPAFILLVVASCVIFVVTIAGTTVDIMDRNAAAAVRTTQDAKLECNGNHLSYTSDGPPESLKSTHICNLHEEAPPPALHWRQVIVAFSIRENVRRFFTRNESQEGSLSTVHGLRVFSLIWVIACHTCLYAFAFSDNKVFRSTVEKDFLFQSISNGNFSVDTFFFVSGMLISYVFLRGLSSDHNSAAKKDTVVESGKKFAGFVLYRFVRLTPPYIFVIGLVSVTMQWFASNSVFDSPTWDHLTCPSYWWRNILYINTIFPVNQMCMIWSWYLAADTQFYVVGILLLFVFVRRPKVAVGIGSVLLLGSWFTTAAISLSLDHQPSIEKPLDMFDVLYDKPWTRFGPYLVGMTAGWLLATTGGSIKISKIGVCVGWTLSMSTSFGLVHALYGRLLGSVASAAYVALSHTLWAIIVGWILIACTSGHGGWVTRILGSELLVPFSRATYCAYLVHSAVIQWAFFHMDSPLVMSRNFVCMLILGFVMSSFLLGIVISVLLEAPCTQLLGLFHPLKRQKQSNPDSRCVCQITMTVHQ